MNCINNFIAVTFICLLDQVFFPAQKVFLVFISVPQCYTNKILANKLIKQ